MTPQDFDNEGAARRHRFGPEFLPVNFNNAGSENHKSLTEIRIGDITAVRDTASGTET